jgi:ribosomal protein S18 acetylase RimI-like enzyme
MAATDHQTGLELRWITLEEVKHLPRLPSGYRTDRVYRLTRTDDCSSHRWEIREVTLDAPLVKTYDRGAAEDWLASYLDEGTAESMSFLVAERAGRLDGLLACRRLDWNNTIWLLDIRVRETSRRRGIGSALVSALKAYARSIDVRGVLVETQTTNYPAIRFYRGQGFALCGFNDHLYDNDDLERQEVGIYLFWEAGGVEGS